jgi:SprT protein
MSSKYYENLEMTSRVSIVRLVKQVVERAKVVLNVEIETPDVTFDVRGKVAGRAYFTRSRSRNRVDFNLPLALLNTDTFFETVIHEVAHLVTYEMYPQATAHGPEFKSIDSVLGGRGTRCHSYDVSQTAIKKTRKRHIAKCDCKEYVITAKRVTLMKKGMRYSCNLCSGRLVLTGKTKLVTS